MKTEEIKYHKGDRCYVINHHAINGHLVRITGINTFTRSNGTAGWHYVGNFSPYALYNHNLVPADGKLAKVLYAKG